MTILTKWLKIFSTTTVTMSLKQMIHRALFRWKNLDAAASDNGFSIASGYVLNSILLNNETDWDVKVTIFNCHTYK